MFDLFGARVEYLHTELVDGITITYKANPGMVVCYIYKVGSMNYKQKHQPFDNKEWLEGSFQLISLPRD